MKEIHSASSGDFGLQTLFYVHLRRTVIMKCQVSTENNPKAGFIHLKLTVSCSYCGLTKN